MPDQHYLEMDRERGFRPARGSLGCASVFRFVGGTDPERFATAAANWLDIPSTGDAAPQPVA